MLTYLAHEQNYLFFKLVADIKDILNLNFLMDGTGGVKIIMHAALDFMLYSQAGFYPT